MEKIRKIRKEQDKNKNLINNGIKRKKR